MALTTSLTTLASKATPRNGFGGASAVWPALSSSRITPANPDASAKAPWTRTTVGPGIGVLLGVGEVTPTTLRHRTRGVGPGVRRPARNRLFCAAGRVEPPTRADWDAHIEVTHLGGRNIDGRGHCVSRPRHPSTAR